MNTDEYPIVNTVKKLIHIELCGEKTFEDKLAVLCLFKSSFNSLISEIYSEVAKEEGRRIGEFCDFKVNE